MDESQRKSWFDKLVHRHKATNRPKSVMTQSMESPEQITCLPDTGLLALPLEILEMINEQLDKKSSCNLCLTCHHSHQLLGKHRLRECKMTLGLAQTYRKYCKSLCLADLKSGRIRNRPPVFGWELDGRAPMHNENLNDLQCAFSDPARSAMLLGIQHLSVADGPCSYHIAAAEKIQLQMDLVLQVLIAARSIQTVTWKSNFDIPVEVLSAIELHHPRAKLYIERPTTSRPVPSAKESWARALYNSTALRTVTLYERGYQQPPIPEYALDWSIQHAPNLKTIRYGGDSRAYIQFAKDKNSEQKYIDALKLSIYSPSIPEDPLWQFLDYSKLRLLDTLFTDRGPDKLGISDSTCFRSLTHLAANFRESDDITFVKRLMSKNIEALALRTSRCRDRQPEAAIVDDLLSLHGSNLRYLALNHTPSTKDLLALGTVCPRLKFLSIEEPDVFQDPAVYDAIATIRQLQYFRLQTACSSNERSKFPHIERYTAADLTPMVHTMLSQTNTTQKLKKIAVRVEWCGQDFDDSTSCCILDTQAIRFGSSIDECMHIGFDLLNDIMSVGLPLLDVNDQYPMIHYKEPWRYRGGCL